MAEGLIAEQLQPEELNTQNVDQTIQVPEELQEAYERVVLAGLKVLFSEETSSLVMQQLEGSGPIDQRIGKGVAGLLLLLFKESNESLPAEVLIPAGIKLTVEAADFVTKATDEQVSQDQLGKAIETMIEEVLKKFGTSVEKLFTQFDQSAVDQEVAQA
jgi:hypothetical protein